MDDWRKPLSHRCGGALNRPPERPSCRMEEPEDWDYVMRPYDQPASWLKDDVGEGRTARRYWG